MRLRLRWSYGSGTLGSPLLGTGNINSAVRMSPAIAARLTDRLWDIGDIVKL